MDMFRAARFPLLLEVASIFFGARCHSHQNAAIADTRLAKGVNQLLVMGFYLLNLGYVAVAMRSSARVPDAARTFEGMKSRGVLVKNVSKMHPFLLANCLRLTVGTADENTQMLAALQASL